VCRYQIKEEPNSVDALVLVDGKDALFRYSTTSDFEYTARSTSEVVRKVAEGMANLAVDTDYNSIAGTPDHPGYHADSFEFKVVDMNGLVSNVATVWINVRLTREKNKPPISTALTFTTAENTVLTGPDVKFKSTDQESPNNLQHTILVTAAGVTPAFASPVYGTITNVGTNQFSPLFLYTPKPFHNGVENLRYYATDAHGATSDPVDLVITVTAVNNAPVGACAPSSAMDADVQVGRCMLTPSNPR
jgi:hypothetical protein